MKIIIAALFYLASFITLAIGCFAKDVNHATLDAVLALFMYLIGRDFEKGAK